LTRNWIFYITVTTDLDFQINEEKMRLPLYISVPHAGTRLPSEVKNLCVLPTEDLLADYDEGADFIYSPLQEYVTGFSTADVARSLIDLNRAPYEIGGDGVIKSQTCRNIPIYRNFPDNRLVQALLAHYYFPYHEKLTTGAAMKGVRLGIDCHTMAAIGPPVGPDPGMKRPLVCVSNGDGTCPDAWISGLASCLASVFKAKVAINTPFRGGNITQAHAAEMPWLQIEISQTAAYSIEFKRACVLEGLKRFCNTVLGRV
jgi:formiminoglutamase